MSHKIILKLGGLTLLLLLALGVWVRSAESGFINYYRGDFHRALPELIKKGEQGHPFAAYLVGQIYSKGKTGKPNQASALNWYYKAATYGNIAAPFAYLRKRITSRNDPTGACKKFEDLLRLSARVQNIYAYVFLANYHANGICKAPDLVEVAYYLYLASLSDRAFGVSRDVRVGEFSEREYQTYQNILQRKVIPVSQNEFLKQFAKTINP